MGDTMTEERALIKRAMAQPGAPRSAVIYGPDGSPYLDSWENGGFALGALGAHTHMTHSRLGVSTFMVSHGPISPSRTTVYAQGRTLFLACCACAVEWGFWPGGVS